MSTDGENSYIEPLLKTESTLINIEDVTDLNLKNLKFSLDVNDEIAAGSYFLRDYLAKVTIKDPNTKKFTKKTIPLYNDALRLFSQKSIKLIDIDYAHLTDWVDKFTYKVHQTLKKYNNEYPFIDYQKLTAEEKTELHILMYSKKLLEYIDGDKVEEFQSTMKSAALVLYKSLFDQDLDLDITTSKNPDYTAEFLAMHIGLKNFNQEHKISEIKSEYLNRAVVIKGSLTVYDDKVRVEIVKTMWECGDCGFKFMNRGSSRPKKCANCAEGAFFEDTGRYESRQYIYIKVQQHSSPTESQISMTDINVKLEGSHLIQNFHKKVQQHSASLKVTGVIKLSPEIINRNNKNERNLMINALTVEVENESGILQYNDKLLDIIANRVNQGYIDQHYEKLQRSMCPHLYGLQAIKTAILLMAVGAVPRIDRYSKHRIRGDINVAIIGDSGLGKSEAGIFLCKILPLSIRTVGGKKTTTAAALTTSYEINNGVKQVINGVLPRCDMVGAAIIDELDKRDPEDMQVLSIPMDDNQMIPTHKSGYHHDVPARCPVLLLGNATKRHGKWDPSKTITEQTNYATWLLSRVDLIFVLVDDGDLKRKSAMVDHMALSRASMVAEGDYIKNFKGKVYSDIAVDKIEADLIANKYDGIYDTEYIRHELHYLKQNYKPTIVPGSDVEAKLKKEYLKFSQVKMVNDDGEGVYSQELMDARAYNGIERVAMAIARAHRHHHVTMDDMEKALNLQLASLTSMMLKPRSDSDKLNDANLSVYKQMSTLLNKPNILKKALTEEEKGWVHLRDQAIKKNRYKLTQFNRVLFKNGFKDCRACHGKGVIYLDGANSQSEVCNTCKGNKTFNDSFTFNDFWLDVDKLKILPKHMIKIWFDIYVRKDIIKRASTTTWEVGLNTIDSVYISDFVDSLATQLADEDIEKEKQRIEESLDRGINNGGFQ
jgi:DNA replicative helicase MCM subunit Mcm2 (Cdc46/Mcm family)